MVVKTEKKVPVLRFPMFNEDWKERNLGYFLSFKNGINARKEQYGKGIKFINVLDILNNDYITYDRIIGLVDIDEATFLKNIVSYGDILFQRSSETREDVGLANVYLDQEKNATFGGFVIRGQRINDYHPVFMNFLLKTGMARKEITSKSGGSTRYNVGQEVLSSVRIILPSLPEQQKIASFLTTIDTRIRQLSRKLDLLEQYKKGVMQQIFSQEIRFKPDSQAGSEEEGKDFPDWEERRIMDVLTIGSGKDYKHLDEGEIPVYGTGGFMTYVNDFLYDGESVCIGRKGTIDKPIFLSGKFWTVDTLFFTHSFSEVTPEFVFLLFQRINWKKYNEASGVPSLSKKTIGKINIRIPSLPEQKRIADFLNRIDKKINYTKKQLDQTRTFKKGLLQQMFV